jgi:hypothetical protein
MGEKLLFWVEKKGEEKGWVQEFGTSVDGRRITPNKPVHVKSGASISLGGWNHTYRVICETTGIPTALLGQVV